MLCCHVKLTAGGVGGFGISVLQKTVSKGVYLASYWLRNMLIAPCIPLDVLVHDMKSRPSARTQLAAAAH